jgi:hypothetical protein
MDWSTSKLLFVRHIGKNQQSRCLDARWLSLPGLITVSWATLEILTASRSWVTENRHRIERSVYVCLKVW